MIALLLLTLWTSSLSGHPVSGDQACLTLTSFQKSLNDAVNQEGPGESPLCEGSRPMTECTTAFLEILKTCIDGIKVDAVCLKEVHQDLSGDKACFCGGLVRFSQMLTVIEVLQCSEDQPRGPKLFFADLFNPTTTTTTLTTTSATTTAATTAARIGHLFFPNGLDFIFGGKDTTNTTTMTTTAATTTTTNTTTMTTTAATMTTTKLQNATGCGAATTTRIIGGVEATENQLPWQCTFYNNDGEWFGCGGTIINCDPTIIVSAAHCFQGERPRPARVTCGDWKLYQTDTNEKSLVVSSVVNHPGYNADTFENDIAVVKVVGTMSCSQGKIWPACLPNAAKYTYEGWEDTVVSGWGSQVWSGDGLANTLKYVKVPPVSDATCNAPDVYNGSIVPDKMICAGLAAGGKDSCAGDSGGPLVTKATGVDSGYSLIGVVSFGGKITESEIGCGSADNYGVYAEFSNYMEWVAQQFGLSL